MTKLVLERGLIQPGVDMSDVVLQNEILLAELAGIWRSHKNAIVALLQARIHPVQHDLVFNATPAEVIIMRQAIIEVALLGDDLEKYAVEFEKREKLRKESGVEIAVDTAPIEDKPQDTGGGTNDTSSM